MGPRLGLGICGPNTNQWTVDWHQADWQALEYMTALEHIKVMSNTHNNILGNLVSRGYQLLVRMYHPTVNERVEKIFDEWRPKLDYLHTIIENPALQLWNEPNHEGGREGYFTPQSFADWTNRMIDMIRNAYGNRPYLFYAPMALPGPGGNIWDFYRGGADVIKRCDGICIHPYWQNWKPGHQNHKVIEWGECYKQLHQMYPTKALYVTETGQSPRDFGGGNMQQLDYNKVTDDTREWYIEAYTPGSYWHNVIRGIAPFILWSPPEGPENRKPWLPFYWREDNGQRRPMCDLMRV